MQGCKPALAVTLHRTLASRETAGCHPGLAFTAASEGFETRVLKLREIKVGQVLCKERFRFPVGFKSGHFLFHGLQDSMRL